MPMTVSLEVPPEVEERLKAAADRAGQSVGDYLRTQLEKLLPPADTEATPPETPEERRARVYGFAGKYAHLPFTVDDFLREKHEEARREAERDRRRDGEVA
jgi:hypothetical protein